MACYGLCVVFHDIFLFEMFQSYFYVVPDYKESYNFSATSVIKKLQLNYCEFYQVYLLRSPRLNIFFTFFNIALIALLLL